MFLKCETEHNTKTATIIHDHCLGLIHCKEYGWRDEVIRTYIKNNKNLVLNLSLYYYFLVWRSQSVFRLDNIEDMIINDLMSFSRKDIKIDIKIIPSIQRYC